MMDLCPLLFRLQLLILKKKKVNNEEKKTIQWNNPQSLQVKYKKTKASTYINTEGYKTKILNYY